jgi:hypothetical protein
MQVGSPEWIEASIAKLEDLEQQRAEHEAAIETTKEPMALRRHNDALAKLDGEIKSLYALLEQYAEDDEDEDEGETAAAVAAAAVPVPNTVGDEELSAPHRAAAPLPFAPMAPLAAPIAHTPPAAAPVSAAPVMAPTPSYESDDDIKTGGKGKWVVLGLLLVGGLGAGGFFMMQNQKKTEDKPAATQGEAAVIKAAEVPDDTEAPKAAKGADVDRTPVDDPAASAAAKRAAEREEKKKAEKEKEKKKIKIGGTDEPLG